MLESSEEQIQQAVLCLERGGIIAYPTESVYGLGCDPMNEQAVMRLLALKKRSMGKGLILIVANWQALQSLIQFSDLDQFVEDHSVDAIPITYVYPASDRIPHWIRGDNYSVAIRVTQHPLARALCEAWHGPLVSTSVNLGGQAPVHTFEEAQALFGKAIDYYLPGAVGGFAAPSQIRDALTGQVLRD